MLIQKIVLNTVKYIIMMDLALQLGWAALVRVVCLSVHTRKCAVFVSQWP